MNNTRTKLLSKILKQKYNVDTTKQDFLIKMYTGGPLHESHFIILILQEKTIIGPIKKLVASCVVGDLAYEDMNTKTGVLL